MDDVAEVYLSMYHDLIGGSVRVWYYLLILYGSEILFD